MNKLNDPKTIRREVSKTESREPHEEEKNRGEVIPEKVSVRKVQIETTKKRRHT